MRLIIIVLLLTFGQSIRATVCVDKYFTEEKLNLSLCQNYTNYHETRTLLFKARAKILNKYIKSKIEKCELEDKKFEIRISDAILTYPHLELTQGKNGYFVSLSGYPTLQQLTTIVDFFAKTNWQPFITGNYQKIDMNTIYTQISQFYQQNTSPKLQYDPLIIWNKDEIRLEYSVNDSLNYFISDILLPVQATSSLPVKFKDRYLFFQSDHIFVFQQTEIINKIEIKQPIQEDYNTYIFEEWANICHGRPGNWHYSYSYETNKFYTKK